MKTEYVIDIGTNSVRLMQAECQGSRILRTKKWLKTVRLGEKVSQSGALCPEAMERTIAALADFQNQAGGQAYCFATSAVREAENGQAFAQEVRRRLGLSVEILPGEIEALCGFLGGVQGEDGGAIDIGGGSTEIIYGRKGRILFAQSLPLGCVRGLDRFGDRATQQQLIDWAKGLFPTMEKAKDLPFYAVGGTATAAAAIDLALPCYQPEKIQGYWLKRDALFRMLDQLFAMEKEQRRHVPGLEQERADIIIFGLAILFAFLQATHRDGIFISDRDNMEGYLLYRLRQKSQNQSF